MKSILLHPRGHRETSRNSKIGKYESIPSGIVRSLKAHLRAELPVTGFLQRKMATKQTDSFPSNQW